MSVEISTGKKFSRSFSRTWQDLLKLSELYNNRLLEDIQKGKVFPAFRNGALDFYYKGGKLFEFKNKFSTHVKYASVLHGHSKDYIQDEDLGNVGVRLIHSFIEGYPRIKENCALHSGMEASGVSKIYSRSGYLNPNKDIVVLDIEVSLPTLDGRWKDDAGWEDEADISETDKKRKQDRIDLLLYNRKSRTLCFFEAKHYSNKELWSKASRKPQVVEQLKRYNGQIAARYDEILDAYKKYVGIARELFDISPNDLPDPISLETEAILLVFGFDNNQKKRLRELLIDDASLDGLSYRFRGNPATASDVWKDIKKKS